MMPSRQAWRVMIMEPSGWLHAYFFKTNMFMNELYIKNRGERLTFLLRLVLPMFLMVYPLTIILSLLFTLSHVDWVTSLVASAAGILAGFLVGIAWDLLMNRPLGILACLWLGICLGIWASVSWLMWIGVLLATIGGIALGAGVVMGFGKITAQSIEENRNYLEEIDTTAHSKGRIELTSIIVGTCLFYFIRGSGPGITKEYWPRGRGSRRERVETRLSYFVRGTLPIPEQHTMRNIGRTIVQCAFVSVAGLVVGIVISIIGVSGDKTFLGWAIWWAITMGTLTGILAGVTLNLVRNRLVDWAVGVGSGITSGVMVGHITRFTPSLLLIAMTPAIVEGLAWGIGWYMGAKSAGRVRKTISFLFFIGVISGIVAGYLTSWVSVVIFFLCYCISYYQFPLWVMSCIATTTTEAPDSDDPSGIFVYLHASSLYWDHWEVLPLPGLGKMMQFAIEQDIEQAMEVMNFIKEERPLQFEAALKGLQSSFLYLSGLQSDFSMPAPDERRVPEIFLYLRNLLRWNAWGVLPPYELERLMGLAVKQDMKQAIEVMDFLKEERPLQFESALKGLQRVLLEYSAHERKVPEIFIYIRRLQYWDAWDLLRFSDLTMILRSAIEQDVEQTREIVTFLETERPLQLEAARTGLRTGFLTLIANEMETCKTLRDISGAIQQFIKLQSLVSELQISAQPGSPVVSEETWEDGPPVNVELPKVWQTQESRPSYRRPLHSLYPNRPPYQPYFPGNDVNLGALLTLLIDVCLDATHYRNSLSWQTRDGALQHMITNLEKTKENLTYQHPHLSEVINHWISTAQHELDKLQQEPQKTHQINSPYIVGQALQPGTSLFVGRRDLVQQLEQGLKRGSHRPTFFLNGERRMGKSSTLRQLPHLLDDRNFLPIFFDLQAPEITSSIAAFLGSVAEKIGETMEAKGLQVEPLEKKNLQEAMQENEARVYYVFDEWLKDAERTLERHRRIVLLSFDEFENLEMVGKMGYLDLHLLLNWFRSMIQNRPHMALLFSGGKSVSEMGSETGINWSGYFVNVQTFRVGFLREGEARQLITQPVPDYPIQQIFGEGVVDEIIRITGCHPFLVQAVCSNLVDNLNADSRNQAELQDVEVAVKQVLDDWEDSYFQDLWTRTDAEQRACLIALNDLKKGDIQQIAWQIQRNTEVSRAMLQAVRHTLQLLFKRDLVLRENEIYRIATPIFSQWVERSS